MSNDHFADASLAFLGGQMAQVWQKSLDAWWHALLGDPNRLSDLARELTKLKLSIPQARGQTNPADMVNLVNALELLEKRLQVVERQVMVLTESFARFLDVMESHNTPADPTVLTEADEGT